MSEKQKLHAAYFLFRTMFPNRPAYKALVAAREVRRIILSGKFKRGLS